MAYNQLIGNADGKRPMNSRAQTTLVVLGSILGVLIVGLYLNFGSVTPCGILREQARMEAEREGGLAALASALSDRAIDALLAAQFGPMTPLRCIQIAMGGPPALSSPPPRVDPNLAARRQAQIEAQQLANLRNFTQRMAAAMAKAAEDMPKLHIVEERYRDFTSKMREALAREEAIYGQGQALVARSQISVAIGQAAIQAEQLHISMQNASSQTNSTIQRMNQELVGASMGCRGTHPVTAANPVPSYMEARNTACLEMLQTAKPFQDRMAAFQDMFSNAERVWNTEHQKQQEIVRAAENAVQ